MRVGARHTTLRTGAMEDTVFVMEQPADVDPVADEFSARRYDVVHDEHQILDRARSGCRDSFAEDDRAR